MDINQMFPAKHPDKLSLGSEIATMIKQRIINGKINPGDRIVEILLAKELGISQTPIREAIRILAGENVVNIEPNKGALVRNLSAKDVFEVYSYRAVLEGMAIRLAVQNATINDTRHLEQHYNEMKRKLEDDSVESLSEDSGYIHYYIIKLSKHALVLSMYEFISFRIQLVNRILGRKFSKEREVLEHWELIEALKHGNADEAERTMREHIYRAYQNFMDIGIFDRKELAQNEWI